MAAMHVLTDRVGEQQIEHGVRPFDIGRDLRPVARLIAIAFADELDEHGEAALRELRILGHMSGLIRLLTRSTGELQDVFNGFVWVEEGQLVGNVTVQRAANNSGRWQIANVAVSPAHRGRGISRALMETAINYVAEMGGTWAVLQVRANNAIARGLYERMGFEEMGGSTEMIIGRPPRDVITPSIAGLQPYSASDSQLLYELATQQQNGESQWWRPIRRSDFDLPLEQRLGEWISQVAGRGRIYRMAIREYENRFEGALLLKARRWQGIHELNLWTRPNTDDDYQRWLVLWALARLQDYPIWPMKVTLSTSQTVAQATLAAYGFSEHHTLLTMRRHVR
ncbi:MAG: GNAT family N-acetyltransferase [Caldilineaceae bacterium]|nr:GNAT family N-acetyltransferase [Caldilineaceae bacterium]